MMGKQEQDMTPAPRTLDMPNASATPDAEDKTSAIGFDAAKKKVGT
jgi:hypothetical protein